MNRDEDLKAEAEQRAREYVGAGQLDWSIESNLSWTMVERSYFRAGFLVGVERQAHLVADLEKQLAMAVERADYAWRNTKLIDAARMEVEKKLADVLAIQSGANVAIEGPTDGGTPAGGPSRMES